jgi:hypothetical protein
MNNNLRDEIARRKAAGAKRITLGELLRRLDSIGYVVDRDTDATCNARWLSGPAAGSTYPCRTLYPIQKDNKLSAFHIDARRDKNFRALQKMRFDDDTFYVVSGGYIVEI